MVIGIPWTILPIHVGLYSNVKIRLRVSPTYPLWYWREETWIYITLGCFHAIYIFSRQFVFEKKILLSCLLKFDHQLWPHCTFIMHDSSKPEYALPENVSTQVKACLANGILKGVLKNTNFYFSLTNTLKIYKLYSRTNL